MQRITKRWKELVEAFTGGNPEIAAKLKKMYKEHPERARQFGGPDQVLSAYISKATDL